MSKRKVTFPKMGTRTIPRKKNKKTLTQRERYLKRKKANEEFKAWFR